MQVTANARYRKIVVGSLARPTVEKRRSPNWNARSSTECILKKAAPPVSPIASDKLSEAAAIRRAGRGDAARLYTTQHTYQPFLDLFPCRDLPCSPSPRPDTSPAAQSLGLCSTRLLQSLAQPLHMSAKFRQPHLLRPRVAHHSFRIADRPQRPSKDQPVEATQYSRNLLPVFRDKLFHGVSVLRRYCALGRVHDTAGFR